MGNEDKKLNERTYEIMRQLAEKSETPIAYFKNEASKTNKLRNSARDYHNTYKN